MALSSRQLEESPARTATFSSSAKSRSKGIVTPLRPSHQVEESSAQKATFSSAKGHSNGILTPLRARLRIRVISSYTRRTVAKGLQVIQTTRVQQLTRVLNVQQEESRVNNHRSKQPFPRNVKTCTSHISGSREVCCRLAYPHYCRRVTQPASTRPRRGARQPHSKSFLFCKAQVLDLTTNVLFAPNNLVVPEC